MVLKRSRLKRKRPIRKRSSKSAIIKKLGDLCRQVIMARDGNACQLVRAGLGPCGGCLQACHVYGKGAHPSMRFEPENVIAGCWRHHAPQSPYSWHSNPMVYAWWFVHEYPERAHRLRLMSQEERRLDYEAVEGGLRAELARYGVAPPA